MGINLTPKELDTLWNSNEAQSYRRELKRRRDYYEGRHAILERKGQSYSDGTVKSTNITNFIEQGVNIITGGLTAEPWDVVTASEERPSESQAVSAYAALADANNLDAVNSANLVNAIVLGYGLGLHNFSKSSNPRYTISAEDPLQWHLIYDAGGVLSGAMWRGQIQPGTLYARGEEDPKPLSNPVEVMHFYNDTELSIYHQGGDSNGNGQEWQQVGDTYMHGFGRVPLVVVRVGDSIESHITDAVISQQDAYNNTDSSDVDDYLRDVDNLLVTKGFSATNVNENADTIKKKRVLPLPVDGSAEYLQRETNLARAVGVLTRSRKAIFSMLKAPDIEEIVGGTGTTSGIALKLKFMQPINHARNMANYLRMAVRDRVDLMNANASVLGEEGAVEDFEVRINFHLPTNDNEMLTTLFNGGMVLSQRTMHELAPGVTADNEAARLDDERNTLIADDPEVATRVAEQTDRQVAGAAGRLSGQPTITGAVETADREITRELLGLVNTLATGGNA